MTEFTILNKKIIPGETKTIELNIATLHTMTELKVPIVVSRSIYDGPTVLLCAGLHGDELTGIEIVRRIISEEIHHPKIGTIICIPLVNIFGFVSQTREFPDGRDLNRVFPGSASGSLASRFAHSLIEEIIPKVDYVIDFHAGGRSRFNTPQIRIEQNMPQLEEMAAAFNPPFVLYSNNIEGSFRKSCDDLGVKYILYEGGKSLDLNDAVVNEGINGTKKFLAHIGMLNDKIEKPSNHNNTIYIAQSNWIRAPFSGMFHCLTTHGAYVEKDQQIAYITDPYGAVTKYVLAPHSGYIINENQGAIVFQGDAIFHLSTELKK